MNLQMQAEMAQFRVTGLQKENERGGKLRDIKKQQDKTESRVEDFENQAGIIGSILEEVKTGLEWVYFTRLGFILIILGGFEQICTSQNKDNVGSYDLN